MLEHCAAYTQGKWSPYMHKALIELHQTYPILYHVHMDVMNLPKNPATGYIKCLMMIDSFSSYTKLTVIKDEKAETVATAFFQNWVCRHLVPTIVTTYQHKRYRSVFLGTLAKLLGSKQIFTNSNRPQSNSKVEWVNSSILNTL